MPKSNVRRINGVEITGTPAPDQIPVATSGTAAAWGAVPGGSVSDAIIKFPATDTRNNINTSGGATYVFRVSAGTVLFGPSTNEAAAPGVVTRTQSYSTVLPLVRISTWNATSASLTGMEVIGDGGTGVQAACAGTGFNATSATTTGFAASSASVGFDANMSGTGGRKGINVSIASSDGSEFGADVAATKGIAGRFSNDSTTNPTLVAKRSAGGTANLQEWQDNTGTPLAYIDKDGNFSAVSYLGGAQANKAVLLKTDGTQVGYATLGAAKTAASSGECIAVYPGTYNERNLLKNGVNWFFFPGATINYTGSADGGIFDDSANGANGAVTCTIGGFGTFIRAGTSSTGNQVTPLYINNASSGVRVSADHLEGGTSGCGAFCDGGTLTISARHVTGGTYAVRSGGGTTRVEAQTLVGYVDCSGTTVQDVRCSRITTGAIWASGGGAFTQRVTAQSYEPSGTSGGSNMILCDGSAAAIQEIQIATITYSGADNVAKCNGGTQRLAVLRADQTATSSAGYTLLCAGGTQEVLGGSWGNAGTSVVSVTGGTCRLRSVRIHCTKSGTDPITVASSGLVLDGATIVGTSATNSVTAGAAYNAVVLGQTFANYPLHANVTQLVGTFTVDGTNVT